MELRITSQNGYVLAEALGPIDESARELLREKVHPLVGQSGAKVVFDLSGAPRINSVGIGNLVTLVADANTHGSRIVFCAPTLFIAEVFRVTKLGQFFEIVHTREEAIAAVG